jgi:glucokinase
MAGAGSSSSPVTAAAVSAAGATHGGEANPLAGEGHVGAIDLGGTKIYAAIFAPDGRIAGRAVLVTGKDHRPAAVIDRMAAAVRDAAGQAGVPVAALQAVGVGAPGPIEPATGVVTVAPNLDWERVPLRAELECRLGLPVAVDNDVRVAVLAEHLAGAGRGARNMVGVWPGTGIGGGLVLDGRLYTGPHNLAGEIGHITIKAGGPRCGCGGRGHLEALASRTAIVRDIARAVERGEETVLTRYAGAGIADATSTDIAQAWQQRDKVVSRVVERAARYLACGLATVANLLNPELIVLGGGVIEGLGDPFVARVQALVSKMPLAASTGTVRIVRSHFGDDAGVSGAALLARYLARLRPATPSLSPVAL